MRKRTKLRERIVGSVRSRLSGEYPRVQFLVILSVSALCAFFASFTLLSIGLTSMALRYFVAIGFAYLAFLVLLRVWLSIQKGESVDSDIDLPLEEIDISGIPFTSGSNISASSDFEFGGGGDFAGGGAGGNWSGKGSTPKSFGIASTVTADTSSANEGASGGVVSSIFDGIDFDEALWLILIAAVLLVALIAAVYVIYIAPALLAEIFVDGVLVTGVYGRVKNLERRYWLTTAVKKTILPALIIALSFGVAGFAMQQAVPEANSVGEFLRGLTN